MKNGGICGFFAKVRMVIRIAWLLFIIFLFIVQPDGCKKKRSPSPESCFLDQKEFLDTYYDNLCKRIEIMRRLNVNYEVMSKAGVIPLRGDSCGVIIDLTKRYRSVYDSIVKHKLEHHIDCGYVTMDSMIVEFSSDGVGIKEGQTTSLCYTERSEEELSRYKGGITIYQKNEIPDGNSPFFWKIQDNWYIYLSD